MKNAIFFLLLLFLGSCKNSKENYFSTLQTNENHSNKEDKPNYTEFQNIIEKKTATEKQKYFFRYINNDVPYYWQGTPWTFSGTTNTPQKGSIACGYFVTNVLMNYGFKIKGNYLAQQASSVMIKQLCTDIHYFSKRKDLEQYLLAKEKNQVYIVGLDFHTGFITRENKDTYFIHSNYISNEGVVKEKTGDSKALNVSKSYMIGNLKY